MNLLIAVTTCAARRHQADAQRSTWARNLANVRFFVGDIEARENEISLPVDDSYAALPHKVQHMNRWALENNYDAVLKIDDDVYIVSDRLNRLVIDRDYVGNFRAPTGSSPAPYASGFAYFLGKRAMTAIANGPFPDDINEDRWVGNTLASPTYTKYDDKRFSCLYPCGIDHARTLWSSAAGRACIAIAQYPAHKFHELETWYRRLYVPF
jgi:hypothetical protein